MKQRIISAVTHGFKSIGTKSPAFIPFSLIFKRLFYGFLATTAVFYLLFQKKLLPKPISKVAAKIFFWPTFPITAALRIGNYWTIIDDTLILGCAPMSLLNHPKMLKQIGVNGVINMCDEFSGPTDDYLMLGMTQLRLPTIDHFEVSVKQLEEAIKFIEQHKKQGKKVYVHCKAGHGRAASVALCWMLHENNEKLLKSIKSEKSDETNKKTNENIVFELNNILKNKRNVRKTLYKQSNVLEYFHSLNK